MTILWREQMSVGVKPIDDDHKYLIGIINEFTEAQAAGVGEAGLQAIARKLYDYAHRHFEREERIQFASKYPFHDAHRREHEALLKQLEAFIRRYFLDKTEQVGSQTAAEMSTFLKSWLVDHIIRSDLRMKGHLSVVPVR